MLSTYFLGSGKETIAIFLNPLCALSLLEQILRTSSESGAMMKMDYLRCSQPRHRRTEAEVPCDRNHKSGQVRDSGRTEEGVRKSSSHRRQTGVCWIGLVGGQTIPGE